MSDKLREAAEKWRTEQREALAWALLPPREWDSYDRERAAIHAEVLKRMHQALAAPPADAVREAVSKADLDRWKEQAVNGDYPPEVQVNAVRRLYKAALSSKGE